MTTLSTLCLFEAKWFVTFIFFFLWIFKNLSQVCSLPIRDLEVIVQSTPDRTPTAIGVATSVLRSVTTTLTGTPHHGGSVSSDLYNVNNCHIFLIFRTSPF